MPMWCKMNTQNSSSPFMEQLIMFHDHSLIMIFIIIFISLYILMINMKTKNYNQMMSEAQEMEIFWTILPMMMLMFITIPSMKTLYLMEENLNPNINIKATGIQWYWTYEYMNIFSEKMNSLILSSTKTRVLSTSNKLTIPQNLTTQLLITSKDVIHSWAIPSSGLKIDAMPGRINQIFINPNRPSIMMGQCSEICGAGHSFMPIILETPNINLILNTNK